MTETASHAGDTAVASPLPAPRGKLFIQTHGCQMNVHDSERLAGLLETAGYVDRASLPADERGEVADVVVAAIEPFQARMHELLDDPAELDRILARNAGRPRRERLTDRKSVV